MTVGEKFSIVKRACDEQKVCQLHFRDERTPRYIRPFGVCLTFNRGLVIVCCEADTLNPPGKDESKVSNLPMEDCDHIRITDTEFDVWPDFKKQMKICDDWLFHVNPL